MPDIKMRTVAEKTVKTIDKSAIAAQHMKTAYVQTKEKAERSVHTAEETPEGYAANRISHSAINTIHEGVRQFDRQGQKGLAATKENISKLKERFQRKRLTDPLKKKAQKQAGESASPPANAEGSAQRVSSPIRGPVNSPKKAVSAVHGEQVPAKTVGQARKTIKQPARSTGRATVKTAEKNVKAVRDQAKTAEVMGKAAVKSAYQTARASKRTVRTAAATMKKAAKTSVKAIRAIMAATKALIAAISAGGWIVVVMMVLICMIGLLVGSPFGIFFSGEDSGTGQTMPDAIREINQDYESKLDEIRISTPYDVLEMSGSRAVWPEVLAIYAVRTTTDPDSPQEVATMDDDKKAMLKEIFWAMNEVSYSTQTGPCVVVTETDDGYGNIVETSEIVEQTVLYITVSHKTADEMADIYNFTADQRAQLVELLAEENRSIWSSVLYGIGTGDGEIVTVALSQIGNVGGQPYWSWYGFGSRVEWCACFVSWCANECGYLGAGIIPKFARCTAGVQWFQDRGLWQDNSYEPRPGDIIFFDWNGEGGQDGSPDHVGIVEKVENSIVYTIEGNSSNKCRERRYSIGYYEILGYGTLCL